MTYALLLALLLSCVFVDDALRDAHLDGDGDGAPVATDCDDADPARAPAHVEACNGVDDDCDGDVDEGLFPDADADGYGDEAAAGACFAAWIPTGGDCDDADADVYPGAPEVCDGKDNACEPEWSFDSERGLVRFVDDAGVAHDDVVEDWLDGDANNPASIDLAAGAWHVCRAPDRAWYVWLTVTDLYAEVEVIGHGRTDPADFDGLPVLQGNNARAIPVVKVQAQGASLTLRDLELAGGLASAEGAGGVHVADGALTMEGVKVVGMISEDAGAVYGGGLYVGPDTIVDIQGSLVSTNQAHTRGGGLYIDTSAEVFVATTTFEGNTTTSDGGGAVYATGTDEIEFVGCTFTDNRTANGRGAALHVTASATVQLYDSTLTGNVARLRGGAVYVAGKLECGALTTETVVQGNTSEEAGGGLYVDGDLVAAGCVVSGNTPDDVWAGGALTPTGDAYTCDDAGCVDGT